MPTIPRQKPNLRSLETPNCLKELSFNSLKEAILSGNLVPGVLYSEPEIAKQLGTSRTPVREALLELSQKGFITFLPRRGFQVKIQTEKSIRELYAFRMILETGIIRAIVPRIDATAIAKMAEIHHEDKLSSEKQDLNGFIRANRKFHGFLAELTENSYVISSLENVRELMELASLNIKNRIHRSAATVKEHKKIMDMLRKRDSNGAVEMMRQHILTTQELLIKQVIIHRD